MIWLLAFAALAEPWTPNPDEQAMLTALSGRHPVPCESVEALAADPVRSLRAIVAHAPLPPYAPMRAAQCLADGHPEAARADLVDWVTHPDKGGLARLALGRLDRLPEPVGLEVARAALGGPWADLARVRIGAADNPQIRALVGAPPPARLRRDSNAP